jgi:hypothetical protein
MRRSRGISEESRRVYIDRKIHNPLLKLASKQSNVKKKGGLKVEDGAFHLNIHHWIHSLN